MQQVLTRRTYPCPVCGYALAKPAEDFTICPSCGVEFGYSDAGTTHQVLRKEWIRFGAGWSSSVVEKPRDWNPWSQLIAAKYGYDIPWLRNISISETSTFVMVDGGPPNIQEQASTLNPQFSCR